jgi:hypothetical protein
MNLQIDVDTMARSPAASGPVREYSNMIITIRPGVNLDEEMSIWPKVNSGVLMTIGKKDSSFGAKIVSVHPEIGKFGRDQGARKI